VRTALISVQQRMLVETAFRLWHDTEYGLVDFIQSFHSRRNIHNTLILLHKSLRAEDEHVV
jgi:hypothetical protein